MVIHASPTSAKPLSDNMAAAAAATTVLVQSSHVPAKQANQYIQIGLFSRNVGHEEGANRAKAQRLGTLSEQQFA